MTGATTDSIMGIAFLECEFFKQEFGRQFPNLLTLNCCPDCHAHTTRSDGSKIYPNKIFVRPTKDFNPDWTLCIEAMVCCTLYHFVKNIPYEWWLEQSIKLGVKRTIGYTYTDTKENDSERAPNVSAPSGRQAAIKQRVDRLRRSLVADTEREQAGGIAGFLNRR